MYFHIILSTLSDYSALQEDVTALLTWSSDSDLDSNLKKFVHLSNVSWTPHINI